jgi:hypothetical protein
MARQVEGELGREDVDVLDEAEPLSVREDVARWGAA